MDIGGWRGTERSSVLILALIDRYPAPPPPVFPQYVCSEILEIERRMS